MNGHAAQISSLKVLLWSHRRWDFSEDDRLLCLYLTIDRLTTCPWMQSRKAKKLFIIWKCTRCSKIISKTNTKQLHFWHSNIATSSQTTSALYLPTLTPKKHTQLIKKTHHNALSACSTSRGLNLWFKVYSSCLNWIAMLFKYIDFIQNV